MSWLDGMTELNGHESEQTPGDSEGQGRLKCCSSWDRIESDTTEVTKQDLDEVRRVRLQ